MKAKLYFEPRDCWIGMYWDRAPTRTRDGRKTWLCRVYLAAIPMLVLRLSWHAGERE